MGKIYLSYDGRDTVVGMVGGGLIYVISDTGIAGDLYATYAEEDGEGRIYKGSGPDLELVGYYEDGEIYRGNEYGRDLIGTYDGETVCDTEGLLSGRIGRYEGDPAGAAALLLFRWEIRKRAASYFRTRPEDGGITKNPVFIAIVSILVLGALLVLAFFGIKRIIEYDGPYGREPVYIEEETVYDQAFDEYVENYWAQDFPEDYNIPDEYLDDADGEG